MTVHCKCGAAYTDYYPGRIVPLTDPLDNLRECSRCGKECCVDCSSTCEGCCEVICAGCTVTTWDGPACAACAALMMVPR